MKDELQTFILYHQRFPAASTATVPEWFRVESANTCSHALSLHRVLVDLEERARVRTTEEVTSTLLQEIASVQARLSLLNKNRLALERLRSAGLHTENAESHIEEMYQKAVEHEKRRRRYEAKLLEFGKWAGLDTSELQKRIARCREHASAASKAAQVPIGASPPHDTMVSVCVCVCACAAISASLTSH